MAPKSGSAKGSTATGKQLKSSKLSAQPRASSLGRYNTWHVEQEYKPQPKISDEELAAAKKMFFALDGDSSGSIDAEELGVMLRSLGQNPTEKELADLIVRMLKSVLNWKPPHVPTMFDIRVTPKDCAL